MEAVPPRPDFARDPMGTPITAEVLRGHLRRRGFELTDIAGAPDVSGRIEQLREEVRDSRRAQEITGDRARFPVGEDK